MDNKGLRHRRTIYGVSGFFRDMGGFWLGITKFCLLIISFNYSDMIYQKLGPRFFRKPEVYKYAYAKKLNYNNVLYGKQTAEEYHSLQTAENERAQKSRTAEELEGTIKKPSKCTRLY